MPLFRVVHFAAMAVSIASASDVKQKYPCTDTLSSTMLSEAVDAAIVSLHGQNGWLHNLRQSTGYKHPIEVTSCTPKVSMWSWPSAENANGLLARVLTSGKIRVAGVKWKKGGAADYTTNPSAPTGFWPEYMKAIAKAMSTHYGKQITVERVYYDNSDLVNKAVADGDVDMSEPYYYLSGFHDSKPRIEALHVSCITVATASAFSSTTTSGITSMDDLYEKIVNGPNRKVGFIGAGNYDAVSHVLPANVDPVYITDSAALEAQVTDGTLLASYISEGSAATSATRIVYETGVISPRVALFRKDTTDQCVHQNAISAAGAPAADCEDDTFPNMIVLIILAAAVFLMTSLVSLLICKERSGKPMFMQMMEQQSNNNNGQVIGGNMQ